MAVGLPPAFLSLSAYRPWKTDIGFCHGFAPGFVTGLSRVLSPVLGLLPP